MRLATVSVPDAAIARFQQLMNAEADQYPAAKDGIPGDVLNDWIARNGHKVGEEFGHLVGLTIVRAFCEIMAEEDGAVTG